jgi:hypothetical protein
MAVSSRGVLREGMRAPFNHGRFNRLPKPLHREFDVRRLQVTPAFNLCLISVFGLKIFLGQFPGGRLLPGEFLADEVGLGASLAICVDNPH